MFCTLYKVSKSVLCLLSVLSEVHRRERRAAGAAAPAVPGAEHERHRAVPHRPVDGGRDVLGAPGLSKPPALAVTIQ